MILAIPANNSVVITLDNASSQVGFLGYRLERKEETNEWAVWDGKGFLEGNIPSLLTTYNFTDYDVPDGFYQYRYALITSETTEFEYFYTDWVKIGSAAKKIGWYFENYTIPDGKWGEALTADDLRYHFLWGIDFKASNGDLFTDAQIRQEIKSSIAELETCLNIKLEKTRVVCQPSSDLVIGRDYDAEEDPYMYRANRKTRITLRKRPLISVSRFGLYTITNQLVMDLLNNIKEDKSKGVINFYPISGGNGIMRVSPSPFATGMGRNYPHGYKIDYVCGYENASRVPSDLRGIIGKIAACKLLNIIGDGLISGFSSSSLSMDGVSESFSSTQSATSAYFGARIKVYIDDINSYIRTNKQKFGNFIIGGI